jgi:hypothetical protein
MSRYLKRLLLAAGILAVALAGGGSAAQASRGISFGSTVFGASGTFTMNGVLTCDILVGFTLSSSTLAKTTGVNQITANGGYVRNCLGSLGGSPNTGVILGPINVQYRSFSGTLPNITRINLVAVNMAWSWNSVAGVCLYAGSWDGIGLSVASGRVTDFDLTGSTGLAKSSGSILCPATGTLTGRLTGFLPSAPTVTLV